MTPLSATAVEERIDREVQDMDDYLLYEQDGELDIPDEPETPELDEDEGEFDEYEANILALMDDFDITREEAIRIDEICLDPYTLEAAPYDCPFCGTELTSLGYGKSWTGYGIGRFACLGCLDDMSDMYVYTDGPFVDCIVPDEDIRERA